MAGALKRAIEGVNIERIGHYPLHPKQPKVLLLFFGPHLFAFGESKCIIYFLLRA